MRPTRVIYVENDPALRGFLAQALGADPTLDLLLQTGSPQEALSSPAALIADAALLDLALGAREINGIDLGLALRERNPDIGIVVYSQYSLRNMARRVPAEQAMGWSFVPKSSQLDPTELARVIRATAAGMSHDLAGEDETVDTSSALDECSPRQRAVMALAATGLTAPEIAKRLGVSSDAVRKDLSRVYRLLVPEGEGGDLRTRAVLAYLAIMRDASWDEPDA